jgi:hypothetical protein
MSDWYPHEQLITRIEMLRPKIPDITITGVDKSPVEYRVGLHAVKLPQPVVPVLLQIMKANLSLSSPRPA